VLATLAAILALTPVPPIPNGPTEAERMERLFGKPVDPDGDCTFRLDGNKLVITVPDKPHALEDGKPTYSNAPRVLRDAGGNFRAQVKVVCRLPPDLTPKGGVRVDYYAAGLIVNGSDTNFVAWETTRGVAGRPRALAARSAVDRDTNEQVLGGRGTLYSPTKPHWLLLTRRDELVEYEASKDGKTWEPICSQKRIRFLPTLKVGLLAEHNGKKGFTATFEDFTVEPLTEPKK